MDINIITYLACICFIFIFGRIFIVPIKKILKLVLNSILGGVVIYLINLIGANFGFHIGLNFLTSILIRTSWASWSCTTYYNKTINWIKIKTCKCDNSFTSFFGSEDVIRTHDPSGMNRML